MVALSGLKVINDIINMAALAATYTEKKLGREKETTKLKILDCKNAEFVRCNYHMFSVLRNKKYFCRNIKIRIFWPIQNWLDRDILPQSSFLPAAYSGL